MPDALPTPCAYPGCPEVTRSRRCAKHQAEWDKGDRARRGSSSARGYNSARWRKLRLLVLREEPLCRICGDPATDVDHITPKRYGGRDYRSNLQALCHSCHSRKTATEAMFYERAGL